jgi:hypothetical protein
MPLFRFHRGGLHESLQTTIIVKTFNDVVKAIVMSDWVDHNPTWGAKFSVEPYPSKDHNFDARIGWFTHLVCTNLWKEDKMVPIGYLSEPLGVISNDV